MQLKLVTSESTIVSVPSLKMKRSNRARDTTNVIEISPLSSTTTIMAKLSTISILLAAVIGTDGFSSISSSTELRHVSTTQLYASGPGYKIGAKTEGVLINNRYVVDKLAKAVPDGTYSEIALLRFALGEF